MTTPNTIPETEKRWTAAELRRLPPAERDAIMEAAAVLAEAEYRDNPELTAFEAFGKDDLYGDSSSRFVRQLGVVTAAQLDEIASAIALCVGAP